MVISQDVEDAIENFAGRRSISFINTIERGVNDVSHFGLEKDGETTEYIIKFGTFTPYKRFCAEPQLQQQLYEHNIPVPEVAHVSTSTLDDTPYPYFIMKYVDGESISDKFDTSNKLPDEMYVNMGEALGFVHNTISFDSVGNFTTRDDSSLSTTGDNSWTTFIRSQTNTLLNRAERGPFSYYCDEFREYFLYALGLLPIEVETPVVIHNDYRFENILIDDMNSINCIIDWGNTFVGHDEYNVIRTLYFLTRGFNQHHSKNFTQITELFFDGYEKYVPMRTRERFDERKNVYYAIALVSEMAGFDLWWDDVSDERRVIEKNRVENSIQDFF